MKKEHGVRYLIGHQSSLDIELSDLNFLNRNDVVYYALSSKGVTKSRNFLLDKASSDIVYFCDDDIILEKNIFSSILKSHSETANEVVTFIVNDLEGNPRGSFPQSKINRNYFNILSVGTIEISLKRECYNTIRFAEDMGAGANIPIGDEAVFLSDCIKNGLKIQFIPIVICKHPLESSGGTVTENSMFARGVVFRRVFGRWGWFILLPFFIKRPKLFYSYGGRTKAFLTFISGFTKL
ncbi:glycosyltransferase family 2 protein [Shewanella sp. VB17]|uniref:glycosyltransferase family A protein n=1 Tax=Shewanella sp. VB17 TaxID=2739432 RepID=UPI0015672BD0|nr:glycosyltransferase family A protein [Shewanella sp. VB17]NRD74700.1 glycosyltransferase family 2 protein [Shewanella sp. VB17]